jgi:hypothetical protein
MFLGKKKTSDTSGRIRTPAAGSRGPVFSYHANRSVRTGTTARSVEEQQNALRRGPRFPWLRSLPKLGALLGALLILGICLQLGSDAKVVTVGPEDGQVFLRDQRLYKDAASAEFRTLLNGNKLTVDTAKIASNLKQRFPELKVVSVSLPIIGNQPVVYIQPAVPKLILVGQSGMFVLDSDGRSLMPANQVTGLDSLQIPVVNDQSGLTLESGRMALPSGTVAFITEVVEQLRAKNTKLISITLPQGTNELHVRPEGVGYFVKYNLHGNAREEVGTYLAAKAKLDREGKTPAEYIDVRVENRAYYK